MLTRALAICLCTTAAVAAEVGGVASYPARPIRLIIGQAPGGGLDITARALAQKMGESFGQSVVADNRAGAAGTLGLAMVAKAAPDGYTVLIVSVTYSINPSLYHNLPFDPRKDLQPVTLAASTPFLLLINPALPVKTVRELIAHAKEKPGQLNYGSGGLGNSGHLAAELFSNMAGVRLMHIPYKGTGPAMTDVLSGQLQLMFNSMIQGMPYVKSRRLAALAVTTARRAGVMPELPTIAESGLPGYDFSSWYGLMVPSGTPRVIVNRLHGEVVQALSQADFRRRLAQEGSDPIGSTPAQFAAHLTAEMVKWEKAVRDSGMRVE